jgi:hypothetical protein
MWDKPTDLMLRPVSTLLIRFNIGPSNAGKATEFGLLDEMLTAVEGSVNLLVVPTILLEDVHQVVFIIEISGFVHQSR